MHNLNVTGCFVSYKPKIPKMTIILEFYRVGIKTRNELTMSYNDNVNDLHSKRKTKSIRAET